MAYDEDVMNVLCNVVVENDRLREALITYMTVVFCWYVIGMSVCQMVVVQFSIFVLLILFHLQLTEGKYIGGLFNQTISRHKCLMNIYILHTLFPLHFASIVSLIAW